MKRGYVDTPRGQIHYYTEGDGEPLLLLHLTPVSAVIFSRVIPLLAQKYRVVAMDTLGYGMSDKPPKHLKIEEYADSVISFMDALGIRKTSIVGVYTGGFISVEIASRYPERVDKLVLNGLAVLTPEEKRKAAQSPLFEDIVIKEDGSHLIKLWNGFRHDAPFLTPEIVHMMVLQALTSGPNMNDGHHASFEYNLGAKLGSVRAPTLVFAGDKDLFFEKLEQAKSMLPAATGRVLKGQRFAIAYESPEEFAKMVLDFLGGKVQS